MGLINQSMWWWGWGLDPGVLTWFGDLAESRRLHYAAQWTWWSCCLSRCSGGLWWADPKTVCTTCPQCREKNIKNRNKKTCRLKYRGGKSMQCKGCLFAALLQVKKKNKTHCFPCLCLRFCHWAWCYVVGIPLRSVWVTCPACVPASCPPPAHSLLRHSGKRCHPEVSTTDEWFSVFCHMCNP